MDSIQIQGSAVAALLDCNTGNLGSKLHSAIQPCDLELVDFSFSLICPTSEEG